MRIPLASLLVVASFAVGLPAAEAIVPPTDCGMTTVKGKRYNIKADQIRCRTAKPHARRFLSTGRRPSGYRCKTYSGSTRLEFRCAKGVKVFFAIRR